jgi:nucleolar protein 14
MAQSQLKRLKASLRNAGVTGQQKPKKAKNKRKQPSSSTDSRLSRDDALQSIRDEFNPFEIKKTKTKHEISGQGRVKGKEGRPTLSKSIGEEHVCLFVILCCLGIAELFLDVAQADTSG